MENTYTVSRYSQLLQGVAEKSGYRGAMRGVHFNDRHVVATDGHMMVIAGKEPEDPSNVTLAFKTPKQKKNNYQHGAPFERVGQSETYATPQGDMASIVDGQFPAYDQALPPTRCQTVVIGINAEYLLAVANALGARNGQVTLELPTDGSGAIIVTSSGRLNAFGIVMPIRTDAKDEKPSAAMTRVMAARIKE